MKKVWRVALREFRTTVATKAFAFALLLVPVLSLAMAVLLPRLLRDTPQSSGVITVIDRSGRVGESISAHLPAPSQARSAPRLRARVLDPGANLEREKRLLVDDATRLALVVVDSTAVQPAADGRYGSYQLFVRNKLDEAMERLIHDVLRDAIIEQRAQARGLDQRGIAELFTVHRSFGRTVTATGEYGAGTLFHALLPIAFMALLMLTVLITGQYLMTSTIEEKSSRVIEVLLSALSPLELMAGKILGYLAVGLLVLALYGGMGAVVLHRLGLLPLLELALLAYLFLFFLVAYVTVASLMAAVGAAVSEMRDAQTLLAPVVVVLMVPWLLTVPLSRDPSSVLSVTLSFLPPFGSFVMPIRLASASPPPLWQVSISLLLGVASAWAALWCAAKVFRIALLLHGKPPSYKTVLRWLREP